MRLIKRVWFSPLLLAYLASGSREAIHRDARRWHQPSHLQPLPDRASLVDLLDAFGAPEVRSVLYARLKLEGGPMRVVALIGRVLWPGQVALFISCGDIGAGLYMLHGFSTIVVAEKLGEDCLIAQQVTVGYADDGQVPTIGDRVRIGAGAKVIGRITIGDDASIGANAVVIRDVAPGAVVGGVPARVLSSSPADAGPAQ